MAQAAVVNAVHARLAANWTACQILKENIDGAAPADGKEFLVVQFPVSNTARWAMNERYYREDGGFRILINVPIGTGLDTLFDWAQQLAALFLDVTFDGVRCQVPSSPLTDQNSDEGSYYTASIVCPYWFTYRA